MKKTFFKIGVSVQLWTFLLVGASFPSWAGGYQVNLMGVKQMGMGHVGTGMSIDASNIYFNPAGLSFLENKFNFTGGVTAAISSVGYASNNSNYTTYSNNPVVTPFNLYISGKVTDRLSLGFGAYTPYGNALKWDDNWAGRNLIQNISLTAVYFQPTAAFKVFDKVSIGAGLIYAVGHVDLSKGVPVTNPDGSSGSVNLNGTTGNFGYNLSVFTKPTEKLSVGFTYHSKIDMNLSGGNVTFSNMPSSLSSSFPNTKFSASLPLVAVWSLGLGYNFTDRFTLAADVNYNQWSAYKSLDFKFEQTTSSFQNSNNPRDYNDAWAFRLGGQYKLIEKLTVRAGVSYDMTPVNTSKYYNPETPDANRLGLSAGVSYNPTTRLGIDAAFLFEDGQKIKGTYEPANFSGTYKLRAFVPGLAINYKF